MSEQQKLLDEQQRIKDREQRAAFKAQMAGKQELMEALEQYGITDAAGLDAALQVAQNNPAKTQTPAPHTYMGTHPLSPIEERNHYQKELDKLQFRDMITKALDSDSIKQEFPHTTSYKKSIEDLVAYHEHLVNNNKDAHYTLPQLLAEQEKHIISLKESLGVLTKDEKGNVVDLTHKEKPEKAPAAVAAKAEPEGPVDDLAEELKDFKMEETDWAQNILKKNNQQKVKSAVGNKDITPAKQAEKEAVEAGLQQIAKQAVGKA